MKPELDHLVYVARDLERGVDAIEEFLGVRPQYGGQHTGLGTHNALVGLGSGVYLEIFSWAQENSAQIAHETPEVMAVWEPMGVICDKMDFPEFEPFDPTSAGE